MKTFKLLAAFLIAAYVAVVRADYWVADKQAIYKIDSATTHVVTSAALSNAVALAVDPRSGAAWVLSDFKLTKFSAAGLALFQLDLQSLNMSGAVAMALDGRDGSVWIGEGGGSATALNKNVVRVGANGDVIVQMPSPGQLVGMAVALDHSVWILGKKKLFHYTPAGSLLAQVDIAPLAEGEPKLLQVDSISAWILMAGERRVVRVDAQSPPLSTTVTAGLPVSVDALAGDQVSDRFYVLARTVIHDRRLGVVSAPD